MYEKELWIPRTNKVEARVWAVIKGKLAVYRTIGASSLWTIAHLPTKKSIVTTLPSRKTAIAEAEKLNGMANWSLVGKKIDLPPNTIRYIENLRERLVG